MRGERPSYTLETFMAKRVSVRVMALILLTVAGFVIGFLVGFWVVQGQARKVEACAHTWDNGWRGTTITHTAGDNQTIYDGLVIERGFAPKTANVLRDSKGRFAAKGAAS